MGSDVPGCSMDGKIVVDRILCILTYGGSGVDMGINYFLLALNLLCCTTITMTLSSTELYRRKWALVAALAFVVAFQVVLCLILGCSGMSIIWCAMAGWMISQQRFEVSKERSANHSASETTSRNAPGDEQQRQFVSPRTAVNLVLAVDFSAILYYWFVEEPITTVAHFCALILGSVLWYLTVRLFVPSPSSADRQPLITT